MGRSYLAWTAAAALALSAPAHAAVANVDVLSRCQTILTDASSSSAAPTPSFMTLADSELPATVSAALSARSLKWSSLSDVMRIGLLWAYGFVLPGGGKGALVQVYTDCDSADRDSPVGRFMDNITLAADRFALTKCANNTCGTFFQATNDKCSSAVADEMLCAVDATGLPVSNESFWADTGSDSSEVPYPQLYTHSLEVANASKPLNVVSIHMAASVGGSSRCGNTGVAIVPCLALSEVSSAQKFCRPQVDPAQVKTFLDVVAKIIADASDAASATTTKNDEKTSSGGLSTGAIIGIAGGALVVLGLIAFYFFRSKKSRSNARNDPEYPGFGRKSSNGNGARPAVAQGFNTNKPRSFERQGTSNTVPLMENGTTFSTDYLAGDNALDEDSNQRSFPPQRRRNSSLLGTSRGGKTFEDYYEESEVIRAFVDDPQIKIRRIPYEELTVLRILSKGSYGEVFLGQLETRHIAMKRLLPEKKHLTKSIEQFMGEIQIMCNLEHRNIVTFVGVSWDYLQNISVIVEYMDNGDLSEVLAKSKNKYTWQKEKISISMDIAEGLVYLHSMRPVIVHRDLKSKNVLLNKRGQAKLSDFGVSRKTTVNETMTSGVGTLLWTAPEIIEGRKYSEKADIFSLGVVLSEIDTCEEPYSTVKSEDTGERLPGMQIVQMVRLGQLKVNFRDDCPPKLRELAQQCTSLDPDMRPTSMEVAYTLKSIIAPSLRASS